MIMFRSEFCQAVSARKLRMWCRSFITLSDILIVSAARVTVGISTEQYWDDIIIENR